MANVNKTSFSVSVTPKIQMDLVDGVTVARDVINENIRRNISGRGEITGNDTVIDDKDNSGSSDGGWSNGVNTAVTSDGSTLVWDTNTDLVFIKHTGFLFGTTTPSAAADTVKIAIDASETSQVSADTIIISELANKEAILLPRPGYSISGFVLSSGSNHVGVETLIVGT